MISSFIMAFLPELVLLAGALGLFVVTLGASQQKLARIVALLVAFATIAAAALALGQRADLFSGAYRVDQFSQLLKLVLAFGFACILFLSGELPDIRGEVKPEYYLFLTLSITGLVMLVSCVDLISLVVALELSSFPLYLLVPMRREREDQKSQMESAIKYVMFGVAANGIMFFGLSYLYGLTGTTHLPEMVAILQPVVHSPLAIVGLVMAFCGLYYKLAVFPFHFWTPDVYQGASNETASLIASLPKVGAVAVLVRFVSLATPDNRTVALLLTFLAVASMFYGNLIALVQKDLKRLLGFSAIAHAGYALIGFVALDVAGYTAALYYITGYLLMILACFVVICRVSRDGTNVAIEELAGLHRRSPLLALTLLVGLFALASIPPFVGFMAKLSLLTAALAQGHLVLVIVAVVNSVIAIYYYLQVIRQAVFGEVNPAAAAGPIVLNWPTRILCVVLIAGIVALGVAPGLVIDTISSSLAFVHPASAATLLGR
ncbi:MAG: NADH-quinone oxidoreductase subunit N [Opitutaceae bacterium]|jgi:NADH-quinone oxidoreductase subunit N